MSNNTNTNTKTKNYDHPGRPAALSEEQKLAIWNIYLEDRFITMRDLAKRYGVSLATIHNAINKFRKEYLCEKQNK